VAAAGHGHAAHGGAHQPDDDFFVAPPPEIGAVTSAHSTLKTTRRPKRLPFGCAVAGHRSSITSGK